jgi:DNA primase
MVLPQGQDPADFVAREGPDAVREMAKRARPLVEYMLRRTLARADLSTVEGRSAAVADALPILERLSDPVRRSEYVHLAADLAGVSELSVQQALAGRLGGRPEEIAKTMKRATAQERVEREMLRLLVRDPESSAPLRERLTPDHFRTTANRRLFASLRDANGDVGVLITGEDEKLATAISALAVEELDGDPTPEYAERVWARLEEFRLKGESDQLRLELQKLNPTTDPGYDDLFHQLVGVDGDLRRLRAGLEEPV